MTLVTRMGERNETPIGPIARAAGPSNHGGAMAQVLEVPELESWFLLQWRDPERPDILMEFGTQEEAEQALAAAFAALDIGMRLADPDLQAYGLMIKGEALVAQARVEEGLEFLDEATVAAVAGDLEPYTTGIIYCAAIGVSRDLADYRRAGEWTEAAKRWCERQAITGFPGICRVHQAEIARIRGAFAEAEQTAQRAADELMAFGSPALAGAGYYEIGEVRMRLGD